MTLVLHILAGTLALVGGYLALAARKGGTVHRRGGLVFVVAMLATCVGGVVIAATHDVAAALNIPVSILTAYFVVTSLTTVRPAPVVVKRWLDPALMLVALVTASFALKFALEAVAAGGARNGMPAFPFFLFAGVGFLGAIGDVRMLRAGAPVGVARIARHLWRMCFALFVAALSFFIGQADVMPAAIRKPALLALPVLAVLVAMVYWLWRVRRKRATTQLPAYI